MGQRIRLLVAGTGFAFALVGPLAMAAEKLSYNRHIRPIISEKCFVCHGPDSGSRKADLRLDRREAAIKAGAIAPGKPGESEMITRIFSKDDGERMPPPVSHKTLSAEEKAKLRQWIEEGAEYQPHWSFLPPQRPQPPAVKNAAWVRNPVDNFILARLEAEGLTPAAEADRRTLARRLSLDLTGLPPSPEAVEAFVKDPAPDAYEKLVDRWMASKQWGEHRGRYWLDAARYADTHGIHFDNYREMWAYRDWVIEAFNRNQPFDQFTIEQLAGDLLPSPTLEQRIASGFNRCNITTNEGGAIDEEYLVLYARDRTETTSRVWMGMTAGCAVCHDHKFDPLSQKEFYQLSAFFNNTTQAAMDGNIKDTPPVIVVPLPSDRPRWNALDKEIVDARQKLDQRKQAARTEFDQWLAAAKPEVLAAALPSEGLQLSLATSDANGHDLAAAGDFDGTKPFSYGASLRLDKAASGAAFARMDDQHGFRGWDLWLEGGRPGTHLIHKWPDDAVKVVANTAMKPGEWSHVFVTYDGSRQAAGVKIFINGKAQESSVLANALKNTIRTAVPLTIGQRHTTSKLEGLTLADLRIYGRALSAEEVGRLAQTGRMIALVRKAAKDRSEAEKNDLFAFWLTTVDISYQQAAQALAALEQEQTAIRGRGTVAHVMQERGTPPKAFVLFRGDYDKRREEVTPLTPAFLPPMPADLPKNRLGFAQWLLRPEHPLMARTTVNRFWQELFGTGLVRTSEDFGTTGELPSHPELLDWLAVEFRESGWDVKKFFRLLVTSAAYRQAATITPLKLEKDPQNRLLARGPRYRMDAEMVRDYALAVSGLLVPQIGGPSVKPYQPEGVWEAVAMIGSNTRDYTRDAGEKLYRRSMYTLWKRAAPPASMEILSAPSRETCVVRRERPNTPLMALVTLNDPQFVEAARHLAQKAIKDAAAKDASRLDYLAQRLLARPLRTEESQPLEVMVKDLLKNYQGHPDQSKALLAVGESKPDPTLDAATLAAWTMVANAMLNLDEVLNK